MRLSSTFYFFVHPPLWMVMACTDGRTNSGPEVEAVKAALDLGVVKEPPEVEGPRAEG
jgi:hypothetical protein